MILPFIIVRKFLNSLQNQQNIKSVIISNNESMAQILLLGHVILYVQLVKNTF